METKQEGSGERKGERERGRKGERTVQYMYEEKEADHLAHPETH